MANRRGSDDMGLLPAVALGTLFVFYVVWAAMHDIAHAEPDTTLEWAALVLSLPAFAFLYRTALSHLTRTKRIVWLVGTALLVGLFTAGAISSLLHPKYALDPQLALLFLMVGIPVLGSIAYHLYTDTSRRRDDRKA